MADRTISFHLFGDEAGPPPLSFPVVLSAVGSEVRDEDSYRWDNARHATMRGHVIQYTLSGSGHYVHWPEGKKTLERVGPGQAFIASHNHRFEYYGSRSQPWEFVWMIVRGPFADQVCERLRRPSPVFALNRDSAAVVLLTDFLRRLEGPFLLDQFSLTAVAYDFLVQLLKEQQEAERGTGDRFLQSVRDLVLKDLRSVNVEQLAAKFGYSPKYFISYFRERVLTTPNRYIVLQKLKYASLLLVNTRKSVAEIADEVGFSEDNYFSKVFRKNLGLAPTEYRERHRDAFSVDDIIVL